MPYIHTLLSALPKSSILIHGDCVGADAEVHALAIELGLDIHIYPCNLNQYRAYCSGAVYTAKSKAPLIRNHDIVDSVNLIIATPSGSEKLRSGTWATIRYAKKQKCKLIIIAPDGAVSVFSS